MAEVSEEDLEALIGLLEQKLDIYIQVFRRHPRSTIQKELNRPTATEIQIIAMQELLVRLIAAARKDRVSSEI